MLKYDFKIEFYKVSSTLKESTSPYIIIDTQDGIYVDISISNVYSSFSYVKAKQVKLVLWNLPLDFTSNLRQGDVVKIFYKKYYHEQDFQFISSGYIGVPMSTDYPSGDFAVEITLHLATKDNFFKRDLKNKQFIGMSVSQAIEWVFPGKNIIKMSYADKSRIITENLIAKTPQEFISKMSHKYIQRVIPDIGNADNSVECNFIFTNNTKSDTNTYYEPLEDYGLEFIPQQEISIGPNYKVTQIRWNAKVTYTHALRVADKVSFIDNMGNTIKNTIEDVSAILSNYSECSLILKLYDDSNHVKIDNLK
ncbi:DUF693 family protein [Borrelia miyamotoi]|uniref:DUF693 family protein n=1 Tax=Borrelia miyamotoi TaxID=47466 RepID=A0AAQ2WXQ8_9SPIR|nr:DUF693 family protein [Borrelia miyamotoi]AOW96158.1 hypothetical protein AXH25_05630 [Borrelia miyamotoi]QTL84296.1 DUF693 family protein [Borrelia miyamotoi]WAZ85943.1 DUF693 family protein [Borrelia miyamotoi]WAZ91646.1 DUF693 family protein [Borrelia miyamotoi]WAZ91726.1 DUF693 family protein [Borrelia miyamotoi]